MTAIPDPSVSVLTTEVQIAELAARLRQEKIVALDTEFIRETTFFPTVEIVQVATRDTSWLIDAQAFKKRGAKGREELEPFLAILRDPQILKILHAAQGDQECFYTAFGTLASPSLDTAVAASLCGYGDSVGLGNLLKSVLGVQLKKGHARTNWSVRPLPDQLLEYAHADVAHLVELAEALMAELSDQSRRDWALELSSKWEKPEVYDVPADELALRLGVGGKLDPVAFSALTEPMRWREQRVRQLNLPRKWVADDAVLVDLARVRPKDVEHLGAFRGLNKGELKHSGEHILKVLRQAEEDGGKKLPPRGPRQEQPSASELQVLDLLKCYVGILADQHKIAVRHLATAHQLLDLVRHSRVTDPQEWVNREILTLPSAELVGQEILDFLNGRRALSVEVPTPPRTRLGVKIVSPS